MTPRILVVDDAAVVCASLAALLQEEGYAVVTADDGYEALRAVAPGGQAPLDLMLLDLQMPRRSGWEVLAVLQTAGRPLPVICMSMDPSAAERAVAAGAVAFLAKPFAPDALLALVRQWCGVTDSADELEPASAAWLICSLCLQLFAREPLSTPTPTLCPTCRQ
jgi:CheY-like chemotaxis protein